MGGSGSKLPVKTKFTHGDENHLIKYASSSMQGWRPSLEDSRSSFLDLDGSGSASFFGVFDGHGGSSVALYCASRFHSELIHDDNYQNNPAVALNNVYFRMDEQLQELDDWRASVLGSSTGLLTCCQTAFLSTACAKDIPYEEGSTACVALIKGNRIIVGNAGDSRCVLSRNGQAMNLSRDHKPTVPSELRRIRLAGGIVTRDALPTKIWIEFDKPRVNGYFAVSRAIGDFKLKNDPNFPPEDQMVTCKPDINIVAITPRDEFLIIASDGVWDVMGSQDVVDFVHKKLAKGETDLRGICEKLLDRCLRSRDNITVILIEFKPMIRVPYKPVVAGGDKPAGAGGDRPAVARGDMPAVAGGHKPAVAGGDKPTVAINEPTVAGDEPAVTGDEPTVASNEPTVAGDEPAVTGDDPARDTDSDIAEVEEF